jgi:hypothetical protein
MILAGVVVKDLTIAGHSTVIRQFGHFAISIFGIAIAILVGIGLVYNELDKRTIYTIVSKPIDRWQFLLGKYLGLLMTLYLITFVMAAVFLIEMWLLNSQLQEPHFRQATLESLKLIGLNCLELAVLVAFALLFSSFSTPTLSGFMTLMVWIAGRLNEDIERFAQKIVTESGGTQEVSHGFLSGLSYLMSPEAAVGIGTVIKFTFAKGAALVFPNFEMFNGFNEALNFDTLDPNTLRMVTVDGWGALYYAVPYTIGVLLIAMFLFGRRSFK